MMHHILEGLEKLDVDEDVGLIIIKGARDDGFCAGMDLREWKEVTQLQLREFFG